MTADRVLVIHPGSELYGSDRMMLRSVGAFTGAGVEVTVTVPSMGPLVPQVEDISRADVRSFPQLFVLRKREVARSPIGSVLRLGRSLGPTLRLVKRSGARTVYVSGITTPVAILAARLAGRRVVVHVHEAETDMPKAGQRLLGVPLLLAHQVVAASEAVALWVVDSQPGLARRTTVVLNAVHPPGDTSPLPACPPDPIHLLVVGRWACRKGLDVAIEAAAIVRRAGIEPRLRLVGSVFDGYEDYLRRLERLVDELALRDCIEFVPFRPDPSTEYDWAHLVLVPSRVEPFGLVAVEGQLAERLVVASSTGGLTEIVQNGYTGLLVRPGDARALAAAILEAHRGWARSLAIARRSRATALDRFSEARYEAELVAAVLQR